MKKKKKILPAESSTRVCYKGSFSPVFAAGYNQIMAGEAKKSRDFRDFKVTVKIQFANKKILEKQCIYNYKDKL